MFCGSMLNLFNMFLLIFTDSYDISHVKKLSNLTQVVYLKNSNNNASALTFPTCTHVKRVGVVLLWSKPEPEMVAGLTH